MSLIGAPDLKLFPQAFNARSVVFRAGLELGIMHWGLAAMAQLRAAGLLPRLTLFNRPILWASELLKPFGTDRGAMSVDVTGIRDGKPVRRRWQVIASAGDGPFLPAVPARAIVRKLSAISPGARPCLSDLTLKEIENAAEGLSVEFATSEDEAPALFQRALGAAWQDLPASVRRLHSIQDIESFSGQVAVKRGKSLLARLAAWLYGFPPASENLPLTVAKERKGEKEVWRRSFAGHRFRSSFTPSPRPGHIRERFFPLTFEMKLEARAGGLSFCAVRGWFAGIPLPAWLLPRSEIREYEDRGRIPLRCGCLPAARRALDPLPWTSEA